METSHNGYFPPKPETPTDSVTEKSIFPPKTLTDSVEKPIEAAITTVEGPGFPPKKPARQLVFTEFGLLYPAAASPPPLPDHSLSRLNLNSLGSPISHPQGNNRSNNGTPKGHKQCHCKQSKCLKLYCECFASGAYCDGCSCVDCHNNVENEVVRQVAIEIILERNRNAFKPKIASSPCSTQDNGHLKDEVKDVLMMGKHNKGCHCKKTGCLKRYCECFQANIFCSENCKCVDCKNFEGCEELLAVSGGDNRTTKTCVQQLNAAISEAVVSAGFRFSPASRKREFQELIDSNDKNPPIQGLTQHQQVNPLRVSPLSSMSADPLDHIASSAVSCSSPYRSLLADIAHPAVTRDLCSLLVIVSETAKARPDRNSTADRQEARENQTPIILAAWDRENYKEGLGIQKAASNDHLSGNGAGEKDPKVCRSGVNYEQEERPLSPGTVALMCDEKITWFKEAAASSDQILHHGCNSDVYIEQERLVLTCFRDCLKRLIAVGNLKGVAAQGRNLEKLAARLMASGWGGVLGSILFRTLPLPCLLSSTWSLLDLGFLNGTIRIVSFSNTKSKLEL